jgi:hypothetical protein
MGTDETEARDEVFNVHDDQPSKAAPHLGVVEIEPDCLQLLLSEGKVNLYRVTEEGTSDPPPGPLFTRDFCAYYCERGQISGAAAMIETDLCLGLDASLSDLEKQEKVEARLHAFVARFQQI